MTLLRLLSILLLAILISDSCTPSTSTSTSTYGRYETITIEVEGPETSELDTINPFTDYRLRAIFNHDDETYVVPGYYAADGDAAQTSATDGNKWHVKFIPDRLGPWTYTLQLDKGENIAIETDLNQGAAVKLNSDHGQFIVTESDYKGDDFRAHGRLIANDGFFHFEQSGKYWIKAGTNSPENLLAYEDFDDTYRIKAEAREGEAAAPTYIHKYESHLSDYKDGDPTWKDGKGKALIGAINYLSSKGMNSAYFLTLNILGDGKDVWPYQSPDDFTRFDVSKLAQWNILFEHMQQQGILLHVVIQETENETMLDNGDTGPLRKLYFNELIARYGHHLSLVWNLGEENGPAPWSPVGQNDAQRKAMASYIKSIDPYNHPVLLHTHSYDPIRPEMLTPILGYKDLDGLSLQVNKREGAGDVMQEWKSKAVAAGHPWLITMDEIGEWHTGALTDEEDPTHTSLMRHALWGTMLSGGAGVEWYFGAQHPHNDLTSEDWRQRDRLWELTAYAKDFFNSYLPYWNMKPLNKDHVTNALYGLQKEGEVYAIYTMSPSAVTLDLTDVTGNFEVHWSDPTSSDPLTTGSVTTVQGGSIQNLGMPPMSSLNGMSDWVILVRQMD